MFEEIIFCEILCSITQNCFFQDSSFFGTEIAIGLGQGNIGQVLATMANSEGT